ncbi:hypothetical protein AMATHDRAFT_49062 [Amanita thiersii Skay4041]|uniref:Amino acid permease/ SLC12A domain-containing protein n=1 Tax=Amanita thiersii Skay4041 TaxID=703135 RepID=A0A2A9NMY1_9AGAR|nr:hypothetical protein AMATHDRAFT_49062 [Amanita thiersii Skay4041]
MELASIACQLQNNRRSCPLQVICVQNFRVYTVAILIRACIRCPSNRFVPNTGGPAVMVWGWVAASCFTMLVGLAMAGEFQYPGFSVGGCQLFVSHPTSGGQYFWAAMLSKPERAPLASWITGWFNLLGQVAITTGISLACANFLLTACTLKTNFEPTLKVTKFNVLVGIYAAVRFTQAKQQNSFLSMAFLRILASLLDLTNTFGIHLLHYLNNVSVWWHAAGACSWGILVRRGNSGKGASHHSGDFLFPTLNLLLHHDGLGMILSWSQEMTSNKDTESTIQDTMRDENENLNILKREGVVRNIGVARIK